ncbi:hypothetical protein HK097_009834 [Rhizophlyctis rosea]|uniref:NADP-dependent oxidoreductase domain-containing protein n=1 Tax=Rhizophlyctis rosea TaxID=64517 RepID=A0AAD5X560_9FUNG|nr:hypothetical protein HK097_009834 [Rhizophlyctis rosea]
MQGLRLRTWSLHPRPSLFTKFPIRSAHSGSATPSSTKTHFQNHPTFRHAAVPKRRWQASSVGFGGYRVNRGNEGHAKALKLALQADVNVVDTSSHFSNGSSEELIGGVLDDVIKTKEVDRESLIVITKCGYINLPPTTPAPTFPHTRISDTVAHSLHPTFLKDEISRSLDRLRLNTIDVFMLNNPERLLLGRDKKITKSELNSHLTTAFNHLDSEVSSGRIKSYGICSHSLANPSSPEHFSLSDVMRAAKNGGSRVDDNFVAVEFPFNLFEREAFEGVGGVMRVAKEHGLFPIVHRPLYAIAGGRVRSLSTRFDVSIEDEPAISDRLTTNLEQMGRLELELSDTLGSDSSSTTMVAKFVWGQVLAENFGRLTQDSFAAQHYLEKQVLPALKRDLEELRGFAEGEEEVREWGLQYEKAAQEVITSILQMCKITALRHNLDLLAELKMRVPALKSVDSLAAVATIGAASALDVVNGNGSGVGEGGGCVLVGMRREEYVREIVEVAGKGVRLDEKGVEGLLGSWALQ